MYFHNVELPIDERSEGFKLITRIQDEAHRFAITYQRSKRKKDLEVEWLKMPGVGHETRIKILSKYKSAEAFMEAPLEDIEILLGKVRGNKVREQVAKYVTDFIKVD